jgi:hypothetical protein
LTTERDAHVERIMAMQVAEGQLPFPLPQPMPQPRIVFAKRPVHEHAQILLQMYRRINRSIHLCIP